MAQSGGIVDPILAEADRALIRQISIENHASCLLAQLHPDEYEAIKAQLGLAKHPEFTTLDDIELPHTGRDQS